MTPLDLHHEPIRLPALAVAVLLVAGPVAIAWLLGGDVREAVAAAIAGLIASGGVIGVAESRRARTDSPATIEAQLAEIDRRGTDAGHGDDR